MARPPVIQTTPAVLHYFSSQIHVHAFIYWHPDAVQFLVLFVCLLFFFKQQTYLHFSSNLFIRNAFCENLGFQANLTDLTPTICTAFQVLSQREAHWSQAFKIIPTFKWHFQSLLDPVSYMSCTNSIPTIYLLEGDLKPRPKDSQRHWEERILQHAVFTFVIPVFLSFVTNCTCRWAWVFAAFPHLKHLCRLHESQH